MHPIVASMGKLTARSPRCTRDEYNHAVDTGEPAAPLTPEQQAWLRHAETLWQRAHRLSAQHPEYDVSDFYHALRNLERTPSERLRLGLSRGRLCARRT